MRSRGSRRRTALFATLSILGAAAATQAAAHPHVWITFEIEVVYDKNKAVTGFRHRWAFDELYTSFAIQGLDKNRDGKYDRAELQELAQVNISAMKEYGYFTYPKLSGTVIERKAPRDYWLDYKDGILTLNFTLPLVKPVPGASVKDFSVTVYDPSFYVDLAPSKTAPVRLSGAPSSCEPVLKNPKPSGVAVQRLGEAFFSNPDAANSIAAQYAKIISIRCPVT